MNYEQIRELGRCGYYSPTRGYTPIKNLGWLLAHKYEVDSILIQHNEDTSGELYANLDNDRIYRCHFASYKIMVEWVKTRRAWKGQIYPYMPPKARKLNDIVADIIAYENGEMPEEDVPGFFYDLIKSGVINSLQGHYQRVAASLIAEGLIEV